MGDRCLANTPSWYVTSHPGQLSLLPSAGRETSTGESAVMHSIRCIPTLLVPTTRRTTLGDRAFPVAAARAWNSLPPQTRTASSLTIFRREVKTHLFRQSYG